MSTKLPANRWIKNLNKFVFKVFSIKICSVKKVFYTSRLCMHFSRACLGKPIKVSSWRTHCNGEIACVNSVCKRAFKSGLEREGRLVPSLYNNKGGYLPMGLSWMACAVILNSQTRSKWDRMGSTYYLAKNFSSKNFSSNTKFRQKRF